MARTLRFLLHFDVRLVTIGRLLPPQSLVLDGRFRVVCRIGSGGMGEVYLANQMSLERRVAIKVLHRDLSGHPEMGERFRREALLLSSVDHPAVVRVIEYGHEGASPCLVMEWAEGETLRSVLTRGPLPLTRAVTMLSQLLEGLAAIHRRDIVHRDLKPDNVVLSWGPRGEQARLLDFGIARFVMDGSGEAHETSPWKDAGAGTQVGAIVGTPQYLAPEQAAGAIIDVRSDLYSFGVLAYETLTGMLPFEAATAQLYVAAHAVRAPRPLQEVAPHLAEHPELCALVLWCLEKDPASRPQNATELLQAFAALPPPLQMQTPIPPLQGPGLVDALSPVAAAILDHARRPNAPAAPRIGAQEERSSYVEVVAPAGAHPDRDTTSTDERDGRMDGPTIRNDARTVALTALAAPAAPPAAWGVLRPARTTRALLQRGRAKLRRAGKWRLVVGAALIVVTGISVGLFLGSARTAAAALGTPAAGEFKVAGRWAERLSRNHLDLRANRALSRIRLETLSALAREPYSARQWGALRYLDRSGQLTVRELVDGYSRGLSSADCAVRAESAGRLGQLGTQAAADALKAVVASFDAHCGGEAAKAALASLEEQGFR